MDNRTTKMCESLDGQLFNVNKENVFQRYSESKGKITKFKCEGLQLGLNLPPITDSFHWCRSTVTYNLKIDKKQVILDFEDITAKELKNPTSKIGKVEELDYFEKDGVKYVIDGKNVVNDSTKQEKEIAELYSKTFGKDISLLPKVNNPPNIKTPDYLTKDGGIDLKTINAKNSPTTSTDAIFNTLKHTDGQASQFIIDITNYKHDAIDVYEQVKKIFNSKHRTWVEKIYIVKDGKFSKIYKRR